MHVYIYGPNWLVFGFHSLHYSKEKGDTICSLVFAVQIESTCIFNAFCMATLAYEYLFVTKRGGKNMV